MIADAMTQRLTAEARFGAGNAAEIVKTMNVRALAVLSGIFFTVIPSVALASEADRWLERMVKALRAENYSGVFTYVRGSEIDSIRIVHRVEGDQEHERFVYLNGEPRELYRSGGRSECMAPRGSDGCAQSLTVGPFARTFPEELVLNRTLYEVRVGGTGRVADRRARRLEIRPRLSDRYGHELWLDEATGLLLQSVLINGNEVLEAFQFSEVTVGTNLPPSALASTLPADASRSVLAEALPNGGVADEGGRDHMSLASTYEPTWIPEGFMQIRVQSRDNHLSYSDGLATFSLFVETASVAELPDLVTRVGGTVMVTQKLSGGGGQVTLVGELPAVTAKRVADSVLRRVP